MAEGIQVFAPQLRDLVFAHPRVAQNIAQPTRLLEDIFQQPIYAVQARSCLRDQIRHV